MGNGCYMKMLNCCKENEESHKGDINVIIKNIENNIYNNYKNENSLKNDNNKNEHKVIKTKSQQSSRNSSLNKSKNEVVEGEGSSPPLVEQNFSGGNKTFQIFNRSPSTQKKKNSISNNLILNKDEKNYDDTFIEPKTKLILTGDLFYENKIEIDKYGMKNGLRQKNDGTAIFGIKNKNDENDSNFYDCLLNLENLDENNNGLHITGKVFKIYFDKKERIYILYFIHNSLILYYKINDSVCFDIDKDYYLILGDIFLTINVKKLNTNQKQINIQAEIENENPKKYFFNQNEMPIKIGRKNCNINIPKLSISILHSIIYFSEDKFYYKDSKSTNGSSLLIREDDILRIKGDMSFKLEDVSFKIREIDIDSEIKK